MRGLNPTSYQPIDQAVSSPLRHLLITGASGYLGRRVARLAVDSGRFAAIWGTWLRHQQPAAVPGTTTTRLDITDQAAVNRLVTETRPDLIIHTAYAMRAPHTWPVTAQGTEHVAQAAARVGARLVHLSSDVIFDGEHAPYSEASLPDPVHDYGRAKVAAEDAVRRWTPGAAIIRTSLICGLDPLDPRGIWVLDSIRVGRPITLFVDEFRNPVWVDDLAAAVLEVALSPFAGIIHVAGPQTLSRYDIGVRLARHFDLDPAAITPGSSKDSGLARPRDLRLDTSLARRLLKTHLRSFDDGLVDPALAIDH